MVLVIVRNAVEQHHLLRAVAAACRPRDDGCRFSVVQRDSVDRLITVTLESGARGTLSSVFAYILS
jgi:hypothetical protein